MLADDSRDPLAETLAAFDAADVPGTPLTTRDVAAALDCERDAAAERLDALVERDALATRDVGERERVWWRPGAASAVGADDAVSEDGEARRGANWYEAIVESVDDGVYVVDDDGAFVWCNDAYADMLGYDRKELVGSDVSLVAPEAVVEEAQDLERELTAGDADRTTLRAELRTADGDSVPTEGTFSLFHAADGTRRVGVVRDVTERRERERELERYERIVETLWDGVYALDEDERFVTVNDAFLEMTGYDREEVLGEHASLVHGETVNEAAADLAGEIAANERGGASVEFDLRTATGETIPVESRFGPYGGDEIARTGVVRDVTDQKQFEETLTALSDSARRLLAAETAAEISETVVGTATEVLDLPSVIVYRHDADQGLLYPDVRSVDAGFMRQQFPVVPADDSSITGSVFVDGEPCTYDDIRSAPELQVDQENTEMRAGLFAPMGDHGVLIVGSRVADTFGDDIRELVEILAANAEATYDRVEREEQLRRQRERLTALNNLSAVVRDINDALVRQSTREEVEQVVCDRLAASDSYRFAWVGAVDSTSDQVRLRAESGVDGYLDDVSISTDPDDPSGLGPTGRAVRTHQVQVVRDVQDDESYEQWRDHARDYGYRSSAAIPIVHEGTLYGVLNVYADRRDAFTGEERTVIGQLGETVGHAIASIERKHALMDDQVVEVEFLARDVLAAIDADSTDATIVFDRTVPTDDGEFLVYGTATPGATDLLAALVDYLPHWSDVTVLEEEPEIAFELHLSEPPVVSAVAAGGGNIASARIEDGDYRMSLHLPPSTDVRRIVDDVREVYPSVELLSRRQVTQADDSLPQLRNVLTDELTKRQRTALEVAYFAGFFEWPRNSSGEEIAESLGVSHPTFSEHLRLAQRKLFAALFSEPSLDAD